MATVERLTPDGSGGARLEISDPKFAGDATLGESVSVNGVCLTVVDSTSTVLAFQCGPETLQRSNLGRLGAGSRVNLERALRVGDAVGGHFVTGHIDCVGRLAEVVPGGEWQTIYFEVPREFDELLVVKGSIAIDGISLTLVDVTPGKVSVMLIPHTLAHTTLGLKAPGDEVNLEFDLIAKHVKKLFATLTIQL